MTLREITPHFPAVETVNTKHSGWSERFPQKINEVNTMNDINNTKQWNLFEDLHANKFPQTKHRWNEHISLGWVFSCQGLRAV